VAPNPRPGRTPAKKTKPATERAGATGIRLQSLIARAGVASRREAERLIAAGLVQLNGKVVTEPGTRAREGFDHVRVDGKLVGRAAPQRSFVYHKPVGCVSTLRDPEGRFCIGDVVEALGARGVFPVGRLDFHSSGLILLTNDGDLAERLMHPRFHVEKRYAVKVSPRPTREAIEELRRGVRIGRAATAPAFVREIRHAGGKSWLDVRIAEGRNQQIRRMMEAIGCRVEKLRRDAIGPVGLGDLAPGDARTLAARERAALEAAMEAAAEPRPAASVRGAAGRGARANPTRKR
jgi:pseudouridine synthase